MKNDTDICIRLRDMAAQSERQNRRIRSNFLSLAEQSEFLRMKKSLPVEAALIGINEASERRIAVFGPDPEEAAFELRVIRIEPVSQKYAEILSHRDYLGAVLNLGLERDRIGDIIIREKTAWLCCFDVIAELICRDLTRVRHTDVTCRIESEEVPDLQVRKKEKTVNIPSGRLDAIVAALTGSSRTAAVELIRQKKVFVDGLLAENGSRELREGAILNIRGSGKYRYAGIAKTTKKQRLQAVFEQWV